MRCFLQDIKGENSSCRNLVKAKLGFQLSESRNFLSSLFRGKFLGFLEEKR